MPFLAVVVGLSFIIVIVSLEVKVVVPLITLTQTFTSAHMPEQSSRTVEFYLAKSARVIFA